MHIFLPMQRIAIFAIVPFILFCLLTHAHSDDVILRGDLTKIFEKHNVKGTFVGFDSASGTLTIVNEDRANTPMIPASTFKLANSLIALETGVIKDQHEIIPYGGKKQPIKIWEQDMPLTQAFKVSNVPVYQELARRIGPDRYRKWLAKLNYGNGEIGDDVTHFWLRGPLNISAAEQAKFISKLANRTLPISLRAQNIVHEIARVEFKNSKILYGKTGWTTTPKPQLGWFIGWVTSGENTYSFALNIDINNRKDVAKRKTIALEILSALKVY